MKRKYLIHEVAEQLGIAPSAIRFYEKKGLISPAKDSESGYRTFDEYDVYKLWSITYHREFGLSLEEIYQLKHSDSLEAIHAMVEKQQAETMCRIEREKRKLGAWQYYDRYIAKAYRWKEPPLRIESGDLHLFRRDAFYDKTKTLFSFINLFYVFAEEGQPPINEDYSMVYDDDLSYVEEGDKKYLLQTLPSFSCYTLTVRIEGDFDEEKALSLALERARDHGVAVKPPYYVIYLLSSGDWESSMRYYEVLLPAAE